MDPQRLQDVSLFEDLSRKDLAHVGRWTDEVDIDEGQRLAEQGTFAYEFFVIEDGTADVIQDEERVAALGPGDFFGEIGLLESERRIASVVATSPMRLIVMRDRDFRAMRSELPHIAEQIQANLEERLAQNRKE